MFQFLRKWFAALMADEPSPVGGGPDELTDDWHTVRYVLPDGWERTPWTRDIPRGGDNQ